MYKLYKIISTETDKIYYGITRNSLKHRFASHKFTSNYSKAALYCAMRKYGVETFSIHLIWDFDSCEECMFSEQEMIRVSVGKSYNMASGGELGFSMREKSPEEYWNWRHQLKEARQGRTPSLGMKHTEENKKLFSDYSKLRWDMYGRYPKDVLNYSFNEAHKKYGISKTHYYRLRKQHNDLL